MSGEMRIVSVGTALGAGSVDNFEQAAAYDRDADFVRTRLGPVELREADTDDTTISLAKKAGEAALEKAEVSPDEIGLLVLVTQNPDHGGLPHNSAVLQGELGLPTSAACFDVGLGCSGYVYGLSIVDAMMKSLGISKALLVTSDQYRKHLKSGDGNTQLLFGDGAAATLLSRDACQGFRYLGARLGTDGTKHKALMRETEGISMNGRAVYGFSRKTTPLEMMEFLVEKGIDKEQIDAFLLHQGSQAIIDEIRDQLDLAPAKVPIGLTHTGNTVSSSIPFLLEASIEQQEAKRLLLAGFGVGLSWGIALLER